MKNLYQLIILSIIIITSLSSCDKEVSTSPPEEDPPKGFIFVDSKPDNYKIYLDGRFTGRFTPDTLPYVEETEHFVELKRKYWLDSSATTVATPNITDSIFVNFLENPKIYGRLKLNSKPDNARVEINDSLTALKTPSEISGLLPGVYNIKYSLEEHRSISAKTIVESNKTTNVVLSLQDTSVWVDFTNKNSSLPTNNITALALDSQKRLWIGTASEGLVIMKGNSMKFLNKSNSGLPSDSIRVIEKYNNSMWVGTDLGLAEITSDNIVRRVYNKDNTPLIVSKITAVAFREDLILVGTPGGLLTIEGNNMVLYPSEVQNTSRNVSSIAVDSTTGRIWVGISGKLAEFRTEGQSPGFYFSAKNSNFFAAFEPANLSKIVIHPRSQNIWVLVSSDTEKIQGAGLGHRPAYLTGYQGGQWVTYKLSARNLSVLLYDAVFYENSLIIASNIGIIIAHSLRDVEYIQSYNSGLFSDDLRTIIVEENGTWWIGSPIGVYKYKKNLEP